MSNVDAVRAELLRLGWSPIQVAGMVGGFQQESGRDLNSYAVGDGGKSFGIPQVNGDRFKALKDFAGANSNWQDPIIQARFVDHELNGTESRAGGLLRNAKTVEDAAAAAAAYERPQGWSPGNPAGANGWRNRLNNAKNLLGMPLGDTTIASAQLPPATPPSTGLTLNSTPMNTGIGGTNIAPPAMTTAAPPPSIFDIAKTDGMGAGLKAALGNDKITGALSGIGGMASGGGSGVQAPPPVQPTIGNDQQTAQIAQGAQQMMMQLLQRRGARGLTLTG